MSAKVSRFHHFPPICVIHQSEINFISVNDIIPFYFIFNMIPTEFPISSIYGYMAVSSCDSCFQMWCSHPLHTTVSARVL